jgi:aryl carrier-like protein
MPALVAAAQASLAFVGSFQPGPGSCGEDRAESRQAYEHPAWLDAAFLRPIWSDGVDFNRSFLELGGDSIKAIRLVALLARKGVRISANELLTMGALGSLLENACTRARDEVSTGPDIPDQVEANWLKHLPSVRWFRGQPFTEVDRFQQCVALELLPSLSPERANAAVAAVKARHQVFALRANRDLTGLHFSSSEPELPPPHILEAGEQVDDRWRRLQGEVCLARRPSTHEIVIDPRLGKSYLLWVCHHLLCDVHTWIYLLDELDQALGEGADYTGAHPEYGVFLWGKWLRDCLPEAQPPRHEDAVTRRAAATVVMTLSVSSDRFRSMEQRYKAERSELIAAALLEVAQQNDTLPDEPTVLFESHGRLFAEAQVPAALSTHLANAAGWFTRFTQVNLGNRADRQHGFLRALKLCLHEASRDWKRHLGSTDAGTRPMICINDIGSGLSGGRSWRHFMLLDALSGGARHPDENSIADFEILVRDERDSGSVCVELRLGTPEADVEIARSYLTQLSDTLSVWDHRLPLSLTPEDFPLSRLTQAELDAIMDGALA